MLSSSFWRRRLRLRQQIVMDYAPLHLAVLRGQIDVVQLLLEEKAEIEATDSDGYAPLHLAVLRGQIDVVQLLLEEKAEIETTDEIGRTALFLAAGHYQIEVAQLLLEKNAQIEASDYYERTPLHLAVEVGGRDIVQLLLKKNAEIEAQSSTDRRGFAPLHLAAVCGHRDIVQLLLEEKAQIETTDKDGQTPLFLAVGRSQIEVVQLLLEKNAQIDTTGKDGQTPLSYARERKIVDVLLEHFLKQGAWSWSLVCDVLSLDNQEEVVKLLDMWPQKAMTFSSSTEPLESMKRAQLPERLCAVLAEREVPDQEEIKDIAVNVYDVLLGRQNLFWAQEVAVTLKVLPGVVGTDAVRNNFLQILADTPHDAIFETDAVQAMILAAWQQQRVFHVA